jgi:hypothetical protein
MVSPMDLAVDAAVFRGVEKVFLSDRVGVRGDESVLQEEGSRVLGQDGLQPYSTSIFRWSGVNGASFSA